MSLVSIVKNNPIIYKTYYYVMSTVVNAIRFFIKTDDHLILFVSYGGRHFNDSPKCIYEAMLKDERYKNYTLVWAFIKPESIHIDTPKIKIDSLNYYLTALKARCWVTNVAIERGLNFRGKKTFYLHTTHTTLPKLMGYDDIESGSFSLPCRFKYDCSCAQSEIEKQMQLSMFGLNESQVIVSGYPKNDILCNCSNEERKRIRKKLGIADGKKVILYAPTYRDISFGAMRCPVNFKRWESILGPNYIVFFRAHPVVANETKIDPSCSAVFDVSHYPDNMELMIASDVLISDYSGIFFEYAVLEKPMFCFAYDYEQYVKVRGLYFDIREELSGGFMNEEELLNYIKEASPREYETKLKMFRDKYVSEYGKATEICLSKIIKEIK